MTNGMDALGDPTRRAIFERLAEGPTAVGEIADGAAGQPPGGLAAPESAQAGGPGHRPAEGTRRLYQLDPQGIGELRAYFDAFWMHALAAFKEAVENPTQEDSHHAGNGLRGAPRDHRQRDARARVLRLHRAVRHAGGRAATRSAQAEMAKAVDRPRQRCSGTRSASTARRATGARSWPTTRRAGSRSSGGSAAAGPSRPIPRRSARSTSPSRPRATRPASPSSTGTWTATPRADALKGAVG